MKKLTQPTCPKLWDPSIQDSRRWWWIQAIDQIRTSWFAYTTDWNIKIEWKTCKIDQKSHFTQTISVFFIHWWFSNLWSKIRQSWREITCSVSKLSQKSISSSRDIFLSLSLLLHFIEFILYSPLKQSNSYLILLCWDLSLTKLTPFIVNQLSFIHQIK